MVLTPDPFRYRLHLVQVGLAGNISAAATRLDGATRVPSAISSAVSMEEFLSRPNYEVPDGTPLIRLDRVDADFYIARHAGGPDWNAHIRPGYVHPVLGTPRRYRGEPWTAMPGWWIAPDVYAAIAATVGVVVENAADRRKAT
ncbi:hypothetical protein NQK81_01330 [Amycolatopsis roodepoortensis]|uniref:hypothetical protein n=1 Tax=Amycolatopsis roodepoortensis TaxID=700274 RepID=UPI00214AD40F|nr:hypothetical protein [Amycolatopsis roodepoortensis]UUV32117.1 hypothetical protein NQK81_01330 [Amycolatopsis roodepoortensis]